MTDPAPPPAGPAILFSADYTTTDDFAKRVTFATFLDLMFSPARRVMLGLIVVVLAIIPIHALLTGSSGASLVVPIIVIVAYVLFIGLVFIAGSSVARRQTERLVPAGSLYAVRIRPDDIALSDPVRAVVVPYASITGVARRGDFVRLKQKFVRAAVMLPGELFTAESYGWLEQRLTQTAPDGVQSRRA
jgi:hypothetical protein